jgi:hypothetical protein
MLPGLVSATAEGAATKLAWYVATQQELRSVVPLTQPRMSAEVRCSHALRLISCVYASRTLTLMCHVAGGSPDAAGEGGREGWYSRDALGARKHPGPASASSAARDALCKICSGSGAVWQPHRFWASAQDILWDVVYLAKHKAHASDK